jgi:outer membrane protein
MSAENSNKFDFGILINKLKLRRQNMKKLVAIFLAMCVFGLAVPETFAKEIKIGYVNFMQVYNDYQKTQDYDKSLEAEKATIERKLDAKKKNIEEMQKKLSVLNEKQKAEEQKKMEKEIIEFRETERKAFVDIKKQRDDKMKEIFEDVSKIVEEYANKKGYDLIFDQPAILYGDKTMDVTSEILKIANQKYKSKK